MLCPPFEFLKSLFISRVFSTFQETKSGFSFVYCWKVGLGSQILVSLLLIKSWNLIETCIYVTLWKGCAMQDLAILALMVCQPQPRDALWMAPWVLVLTHMASMSLGSWLIFSWAVFASSPANLALLCQSL